MSLFYSSSYAAHISMVSNYHIQIWGEKIEKKKGKTALLINIPLVMEGREGREIVLLTFNFWKAFSVKVLGRTF